MNTNAINNIPKDGNHIRVVYHKDGPSTHAFRFADWSEAAENPYGAFVTPTIASWFYMSGDGISNAEMRSLLNGFDYGSGNLPVKDSNFLNNMNNFKPAGYPHFFPEGQDCEFTNWFSEEGSATAMCGDDRVVTGIECSGRYCDSKRLKCCNVANVVPFGSSWENNSSISEESPNSYSNDNAVMVGLKCSGSYCDNLTPIMRNNSAGQSGSWVPYFSEEQGLGECPAGSYVAGIACSGSYCDSLSLYCQQQ
jgi:hypothetical protein